MEVMLAIIGLCLVLDLFRWGHENQHTSKLAAFVERVRKSLAYEG